jgi:hypothetical protein
MAILAAEGDGVDQVGGVLDLARSDVVPVLEALHEPVQVPERSPGHRGEEEQGVVPLLEPETQRSKRQRDRPSFDDEQPAVVAGDNTKEGVVLLGQVLAQQRLSF